MRVAVVGAGITGLSTAWHLAQRGVDVTVYEKDSVGAGGSGVQPGGVRRQWGTRAGILLASRAWEFWQRSGELLRPRTPLRFRECGYLFCAHEQATLRQLRTNVELQNEHGVPSRMTDADTAGCLAPGLVPEGLVGAAWCGTDGYFDNAQAVVEAFAEAAWREGVAIERRHVRSLGELDEERVVVATGPDTRELLPGLPIEPEPRTLFLSEPIRERLLEPLVVAPDLRFAAKQLADGRVLASDLTLDDADERERRARVRRRIAELLPALEFATFSVVATGIYDVSPDQMPLLGAVGERAVVAAGFSGHGFMLSPEIGRGVAAMALGEDPGEPFAELAPDRFDRDAAVTETQVV